MTKQKHNATLTRYYRNLHRAFILTRHTAFRSGHAWALKLNRIDLDNRLIRITENTDLNWHPKGMKWPNKPINDKLYNFLSKDLHRRKPHEQYYLDNGRGGPWYTDPSSLGKSLKKELRRIGINTNIKAFHWGVRATVITWLLNEGVPPQVVQQLADHSNLATTMKYYNTRNASQKTATDLLSY